MGELQHRTWCRVVENRSWVPDDVRPLLTSAGIARACGPHGGRRHRDAASGARPYSRFGQGLGAPSPRSRPPRVTDV